MREIDLNSTSLLTCVVFTQVQLDHGGNKEEAGPWDVDIEHVSSKCGDDESVSLIATVIGNL